MDDRYDIYCVADPLFYEALHGEGTGQDSFGIFDRPMPAGWSTTEHDDWRAFLPPVRDLPLQGWKIHASACPDNADRVLAAIWDYCVPRGIEFKTLRSPTALFMRSSKYAPRGYSGKLATIYPADEPACERILRELSDCLAGEPGPYILSDLRYGAGPLYVRYGAFVGRYCVGPAGGVVAALDDGTGTLVPDRRDPVFRVPPWVDLPDFLAPHLQARNTVTITDIPYTIDTVLHFSNGGGLYRGRDRRTGTQVVLKEGRPHAGLDADGADAVARVKREYDILTRLAGVPGAPRVHDLFPLGDHWFLAMEYVEGTSLNKEVVARHPLTDGAAGPAEVAAYTRWALDVHDRVAAAVEAMHARGVVYGDLHLFNIIVRPDGEVTLLDYEVATLVEENRRPGLGNQGFAAPPGVTGRDVDRYGLACLRLALFLPLTQLLWLSPDKAGHLADVIAAHFPVPPEFLTEAVGTVTGLHRGRRASRRPARRGAPEPADASPPVAEFGADWPTTRDRLRRAILASATPHRADRLFPGDVAQFSVGGIGLAHGAAGVLYALDVTGAGRHAPAEDWLLRQAEDPPNGTMIGLYDGLHGVAYTLDHLGHRDAARRILDRCRGEDWRSLGSGLASGLAGIGLNLDHFAVRYGDSTLRAEALAAADLVAERLGDADSVPTTSGGAHPYAGLFRGSSGPALLLLRAHELTGDPAYLDRAAVALRQDLRRCVLRDTGELDVNEGWRTMPYLGEGSVGIGLALDRYLRVRADDRFAAASAAIRRTATGKLYVQSGLYAGRAGILLFLAESGAGGDPAALAQVRALAWHALPYGGGWAFPGEQLLRLSMDLATGSAGVLLAVGAALHERPVHLPLLSPTAGAARPTDTVPTGRGLIGTTS
ncbi:class III lanthionine synthetase LanKC [Pilimelia columellifera]|uniref:non-specific serine/threonine protein kinase n=1 Tax=Pilimelia columellifera subsp. columellifera TaxID=706583 RepID=A0ABN3NR90_9ACTN